MFPTFFAANAVSVCLLQHCHPGQARQYTTGEIFGEQAAKKRSNYVASSFGVTILKSHTPNLLPYLGMIYRYLPVSD